MRVANFFIGEPGSRHKSPMSMLSSRNWLRRCSKVAQLLVLIFTASPAAAAARSVALLPIRGDAAVGDRLEHDLSSLYDVVEGEAAQRLRQPGLSADNLRDLAMSLRIDALIEGEVRMIKGHKRLETVVREASSGEVLGRGEYDLSRESLDDAVCDLVFALTAAESISQPSEEL